MVLAFFKRRVVLGILFTVILALMFAPLVRSYVKQRGEIAAARQEVQERQQAIAELEAAILRWEDPEYVKQQARERLMFVQPGDTQYLVVDDTPGRKGGFVPDPNAPVSVEPTPSVPVVVPTEPVASSAPEATKPVPGAAKPSATKNPKKPVKSTASSTKAPKTPKATSSNG